MMGGAAALTLVVLSGLCLLPASSPRKFILVQKLKSWSAAQEYCRDRYTDLATVRDQQDQDEINFLNEDGDPAWIGLHYDRSAPWRWTLENPDFYGEGEADFRFETLGQHSRYKACVYLQPKGGWDFSDCGHLRHFVCYNGTQNSTAILVVVEEALNWNGALSYCRKHYIDLASVRNEAENQRITNLTQGVNLWIGLREFPWSWSDGDRNSYSYWVNAVYQSSSEELCVVSTNQTWDDRTCESEHYFFCHYDGQPSEMRTQRVRVMLKKSDSSVKMEDLKEDILLKLQQQLKAQGVNEDVKLKWVKQSNGKVFHKMEKRKKKREHREL